MLEQAFTVQKISNTVIAIIPARGGSKGVPRKNVRLVGGLPLVAHNILAAKHSRKVDRVAVSTDDAEIAEVARRYGAEVIWRPQELSGDTASSESALIHVLDTLASSEGCPPAITVFLQCTSPLTLPEDIDACLETMEAQAADCAFTAAPFHRFVWRNDAEGQAAGVNHDSRVRQRRQDRIPEYVETGAVYAMRTEGFLKARHRFFGKIVLCPVPVERSMEIDDLYDLEVADRELRRQAHQSGTIDFEAVRGLAMDFDGVFTDDCVYVGQDGHEMVRCSRGDGMGLELLRKTGFPMVVLSKEKNPVVSARCRKLGLECTQSLEDKVESLKAWAQRQSIPLEHILYLGNDINDIPCMKIVGMPITPADAHPLAQQQARHILQAKGGNGAIREIADHLLEALRKRQPDAISLHRS